MSTDFAKRLTDALDAAGKSLTDLAGALGDISRSGVGPWASGRRTPSHTDIARLAVVLEVRAAWLAFGEEPMRLPTAADLDVAPLLTVDTRAA
jgi:transcriptional regulator with XRE-family HTH domain